MLKWLEDLSRRIGLVEQAILVLCLILMILLAFIQVLLRFIPGSVAITWLEPFARQLVLWVGLLGASFATAENRHISIEALPKLMTKPQRKWLGVFMNFTAAGIALLLAVLGWIWLIGVDREEIATAQEVSHALVERAESLGSKPRPEIVKELRKQARERVDLKRLQGLAKLVRSQRVTLLKLENQEAFDGAYVAPAKRLLESDSKLEKLSWKQKASLETVEWVALAFEAAANDFSQGNHQIADKAFEGQPANSKVAASIGDSVSVALFDIAQDISKKPELEPAKIMRDKAKLTMRMADQKAYMEIFGLPIHEWWFHIVVPVALFLMAFRFLIGSFIAFSLSPEEYAEREETLKKDIEAFERGQSGRMEAASGNPEVGSDSEDDDSRGDLDDSDGEGFNADGQTRRMPVPSDEMPRFSKDFREDVPQGALETVDMVENPGPDILRDEDKVSPPIQRSASTRVVKPDTVDTMLEDATGSMDALENEDSGEDSKERPLLTESIDDMDDDDFDDDDSSDGDGVGVAVPMDSREDDDDDSKADAPKAGDLKKSDSKKADAEKGGEDGE